LDFELGAVVRVGVGKRLRLTSVDVVVPDPGTTTVAVAVTVVDVVVDPPTEPMAICWKAGKSFLGLMAKTMPDLQ